MPPMFRVIRDLSAGRSPFALKMCLVRTYTVLDINNLDSTFSNECIFHDTNVSLYIFF